jgi:hypothetical protein
VNALPFAAQPKIHNPVLEAPRNKSVCFAGTYYSERYHERKADMDFLLKPSLEYGLDIFDRHYGDTGKTAGNFKFPGIYQDAIRGKLDYHEMVKAYKQYRVFLNVNSVKYSPTMFARRVFEILASGTPVISTFSQGMINLLGEGTVFISESESDTRKHLDHLLGNEHNWWRASLKGLRKVMEEHTYQERTKFIFNTIGLESNDIKKVKFSVASRVATMEDVRYLEMLLRHQSYSHFDVVLIIKGDNISPEQQTGEIMTLFAPLSVKLIKEDSVSPERVLLDASDSEHVAFFHTDKYYGPNYLKDHAMAVKYADPKIVGKKTIYRIGKDKRLVVSDKGFEFRYVSEVPHATSVHRKNSIDPSRIRDYLSPGYIKTDEPVILSIDPYNFLEDVMPIRHELFNIKSLDEINI